MKGLRGAKARVEAERLARFFDCSVNTVYNLTRDLRPRRRVRSDAGERAADVLADDALRHAAELVVCDNLKPELALEMAELNAGCDVALSLASFRRWLRENGLNRRARRTRRRAYRPFEAERPQDIYQFDISGVKERWVDVKTRRLYQVSVLEDSRNHPYEHPTRVKLWKFSLIDDRTRRRFVRFVACEKPNSTHCIEFLLEAFRLLGIPRLLYTDRDRIILSERMSRLAEILNLLFESDGGFRLDQHRAGNPQATGKVERTHQIIEEFEPLIGLYERSLSRDERGATLERLNEFADQVTERLNWQTHRTTGEIPMERWTKEASALRCPPPAVLDSVFTADEFTVPVAPDVTIALEGVSCQLPRSSEFPFREWAETGRKCRVVVLRGAPSLFVVLDDGSLVEVEKVVATPDVAGEFKALTESRRARTAKLLRESARARRAARVDEGSRELVPLFDSASASRPVEFPKPRREADTERLLEHAPAAAALLDGRLISRFQAIELFQREGFFSDPISNSDRSWLISLYADREEMLDSEVRAALVARAPARRRA